MYVLCMWACMLLLAILHGRAPSSLVRAGIAVMLWQGTTSRCTVWGMALALVAEGIGFYGFIGFIGF